MQVETEPAEPPPADDLIKEGIGGIAQGQPPYACGFNRPGSFGESSSRRMASANSAEMRGFRIISLIPRPLVLSQLLDSAWPVQPRMGISGRRARASRARSSPDNWGMVRSVRI